MAPAMQPVPMLAPERHLQSDALATDRILEAAQALIASGRYILGEEVVALEREVAEAMGSRYALGVSSGTDALLLSLMALGVAPGDQVICPSYTFFATAGVVARLGARPVFVDSCPACMALDVAQTARSITPLTRAIVPVHLFGHAAPMAQITALGRSHGVAVVEDVAQAMGTRLGDTDRCAGTLGQLGCLSFFPSKNLGGFGDGGMVLGQDAALMDRARSLRMHGASDPRYVHRQVGGNFRLDALQATLLRCKLPDYQEHLARRRAHAERYTEQLMATQRATQRRCSCASGTQTPAEMTAMVTDGAALGLPSFAPGDTVNQFVVTLSSPALRDRVHKSLTDDGVQTSIYYPLPLHLQPCFAHLGYNSCALPTAERLSQTSLALPIAAELTEEEIDRVCASLVKSLCS